MKEVEFGNRASDSRNLSKFQNAYLGDEMALGIYVTATSAMSKRVDSGLAKFETACAALDGYHENFMTHPLVVIGVDVDPENEVDWAQSGVSNATLFSGTNGSKAQLYYFVEQYRAGIVLESIAPSHEPSVQKRAKAISRKVHSARQKSASAGAVTSSMQLGLF